MSNGELVSVAPRPRQVIVATTLIAVPAFVAVLILLNQAGRLGGYGGGNLLLLCLALPALATGILAVGFAPGRDGLRRAALVLCSVSAILTGGVAVVSTVLAVTNLGRDRTGPWSGLLTAILTAAALVGAFFAVVNGLAIRMLRTRQALDWFAAEHDDEAEEWRPSRALLVLMGAAGAGGVIFLLATAGIGGLASVADSESLGACASVCAGILALPLLRGTAGKLRTAAIITGSFGAFVWALLTLLTLFGGTPLLGLVALTFTAAHIAMIVLLARTEPLPAHDDTSG
ncbi:hypothetical protein [Phytomonospora endophytica]|uniref:MFS family permease n=1 Tax=Phytomonospora endophytica TaxID=714109 RepID=A0A841FE06_9ACTN|nr:hypothetical protein [Phytomonospora endophytica]MBB6034496.1 MFS family permease [Phytomonospora endophytica]GIG70403.1 hypothetical protein Pen01_66980 [Phytomonospora endophytica]